MSYTAECEECGETGIVPQEHERVTRGTRLYRTPHEEYLEARRLAAFADSEEERAAAGRRAEHVATWEHYCPEHAVEKGIAPAGAAREVVYRCEECGHVDRTHSVSPVGGGQATCRECGAAALRRDRVDDASEVDA